MTHRRVLIISRQTTGGMRRHIALLINGISSTGYDVTLLSPCRIVSPAETIKTVAMTIPSFPLSLAGLKIIGSIFRLYLKQQYDIVHTHGYVAGLYGRLAALLTKKDMRPAVVHTVHNFPPDSRPTLRFFINLSERILSSYTGKIITVSDALNTTLQKAGIPASKIITIYNGIPEYHASPKQYHLLDSQTQKLLHGRFIVGTVARLIPSKGIDTFIRAFALLTKTYPGLAGIIIGDGPEKEKLQSLSAKLELSDSLFFVGHRDDVISLLSLLDLFVLPSKSEGLGISILEAQMLGIPVVASAAGGIPEIVTDRETGLLFPPGNVEELADRMANMINDTNLRLRLAAKAGLKVRDQFSSVEMNKKTMQVYENL